jgi:uncharacterized membrane protein
VITGTPRPGQPGSGQCVQAVVSLTSGPNQGAETMLEFTPGPGQPNLAAGEHIRVIRAVDDGGATSYGFYDYERGLPLALLALVFAVVIVAVARWRGFRALVGILVAFAVLVVFLLPALRDGAPAIPVALVASAAILFAVIYLAHGVSLRTSAALLGTLTALLLSAGLSWAAIKFVHLTGLSEDQNNEVAQYMGHVSITGLLLPRCAQRRDDHPGVGGVRVGRRRRRPFAADDFRLRHARRQRPHRLDGLHAGAGLCR